MSSQNYNWHQYKLYFKNSFKSTDIEVLLEESTRETNEHLEKVIEHCWMDQLKGRKSVGLQGFINSIVYRLNYFKNKKDKLILSLGETSFRELQGTNATNWILAEIYGSNFLANGILVQSLVFTSDGYLVLGRRVINDSEGLDILAIFGGALEKPFMRNGKMEGMLIQNSKDIFGMMRQELREEVGVGSGEIEDIKLISLFEDWKHYPIFLFETKLKLSSKEIESSFNGSKEEHSGIIAVNLDKVRELVEEKQEMFSDLTLAAFEIWDRI